MRGSLEVDARPVEAFRTLALKLLDDGLAEVREHAVGDEPRREEGVRLVRKSTKALRALLPLLVEAAPPEAIAAADRMLGDAAGLLSPIRDRDAMLKTIDRLFAGKEGQRVDEARAMLRAAVVPSGSERDRSLEDLLVDRAGATLERVRHGVADFRFERVTRRCVARTMARAWAQTRRHSNGGWDEGDGTEAHTMRKACGRLALQCSFLEVRKPRPFERLRKTLRAATSSLGDEHDLSMLAECIALERSRFPGDEFVEAALGLCRAARHGLRAEAAKSIDRAFALRAKELRRAVLRALDEEEPAAA